MKHPVQENPESVVDFGAINWNLAAVTWDGLEIPCQNTFQHFEETHEEDEGGNTQDEYPSLAEMKEVTQGRSGLVKSAGGR